MLPRRLIRLLIGQRWRTFIGTSHSDAVDAIETTLLTLEWPYTREDAPNPTSGERALFGSRDKVVFNVDEPNLRIECASVSVDPLMKLFLRVGSRQNTIDEFSNTVALLDIRPITAHTHAETAVFIQTLRSEFDTPPWDIHHPRFQYAPVLTYKVKLLWTYWLGATNG